MNPEEHQAYNLDENNMSEQSSSVLVISLAVNGYAQLFAENLASHARYCKTQGYRHCVINKVGRVKSWQAAWMKVALMDHALRQGYHWVVTLDADCFVQPHAPAIRQAELPGKSIHMARGFSGNLNSGVMIVRSTTTSRMFYRTVLRNCERNVAGADWGENGHICFYAAYCREIGVIDRRWNNNFDPTCDDYVRHFCGGTVLADQFGKNRWQRLWLHLLRPRFPVTQQPDLQAGSRKGLLKTLRGRLLYCLAQYPALHGPDYG